MPVGLGRRAQHLELRPDRAAFGLALGRHPRVDPDPHSPTARNISLAAGTLSENAYISCNCCSRGSSRPHPGLFTGRQTFVRQGRAASLHLPFLGIWFVLITPVVAGLLAGLIGVAFQKTLYKGDDTADAVWGKRAA